MRRVFTLLLGLHLLAATAAAQDGAEPQVIDLPAADRSRAVTVEDVYRLGGAAPGDAWQEFGRVRAVAFGPDGRLYILDQQARQVHAVAPDGRYLGPLGRAGEGPGEYQLPTDLAVAPDGTVAVRDTRTGGFVLFGADASYKGNIRPDASRGRISQLRLGPGGWLYGTPSLLLRSVAGGSRLEAGYLGGGGEGTYGITHMPLLRVHLEEDRAEPVGRLWIAPRDAGDGSAAQMAFVPDMHWTVLPDGSVAVADTTTWTVRILATHLGGTDRSLRRPLKPRPVGAAEREAELARRAAQGPAAGGGGVVAFGDTEEERDEALARARRRQLEAVVAFYPEIQVIQGLRSDPAGRLWIQRAGERVGEPGPVDVVMADGTYLGTIRGLPLPDAFGPDGLAAWVERGELDVPVVVVRRVRLQE